MFAGTWPIPSLTSDLRMFYALIYCVLFLFFLYKVRRVLKTVPAALV